MIKENQQKEISDLKRSELEIQRLKSQQVDDKKQVLHMISKLVGDPEKFKEILKKSINSRNFFHNTEQNLSQNYDLIYLKV